MFPHAIPPIGRLSPTTTSAGAGRLWKRAAGSEVEPRRWVAARSSTRSQTTATHEIVTTFPVIGGRSMHIRIRPIAVDTRSPCSGTRPTLLGALVATAVIPYLSAFASDASRHVILRTLCVIKASASADFAPGRDTIANQGGAPNASQCATRCAMLPSAGRHTSVASPSTETAGSATAHLSPHDGGARCHKRPVRGRTWLCGDLEHRPIFSTPRRPEHLVSLGVCSLRRPTDKMRPEVRRWGRSNIRADVGP